MNYPLARSSDPLSSHIANDAISKDRKLSDLILEAVQNQYWMWRAPVTDDQILVWIEDVTKRRQQRNVIARARGLLEREGLLVRVETVPRVAVVVQGMGIDE